MAQGKLRALRRDPNEPAYALLRTRLAAARKAAHLTQEMLALRLGKPQSFVAKYETGERFLDVVEFAAICDVLRADRSEILDELADAATRL